MDKVIKEIAKSIGIKILILLIISISLSALLSHYDGVDFFKSMKTIGVLFVIMGVATFLPSERAVISNFQNPIMFTEYKKPYHERMLKGNTIVFSKGGVQVIIAAIIIIGLTFLMEQLI